MRNLQVYQDIANILNDINVVICGLLKASVPISRTHKGVGIFIEVEELHIRIMRVYYRLLGNK